MNRTMRISGFTLALIAFGAVSAWAQLTLELKDFLTMPITGRLDASVKDEKANDGKLARVNALRDEPGGKRFFLVDQNGPVYILDKGTQQLTTYLNFNGREGWPGLFHRFSFQNGHTSGLNHL